MTWLLINWHWAIILGIAAAVFLILWLTGWFVLIIDMDWFD